MKLENIIQVGYLLRRSRATEERGSVLLELGIALPFLMLLISGTVNIGRFFWTLEFAHDAVRYAAGQALGRSRLSFNLASGSHLKCSEVRASVIRDTEKYLEQVMSKEERSIWGKPEVIFFQKSWGRDQTDVGISLWYVTTSLNTVGSRNCLFCYDNILNYIDYVASATYVLHQNPQMRCL